MYFKISHANRGKKIQRLANGSTIVESRYLFSGFDNEIEL